MTEALFSSSLPWDAQHSPTLVMYCSDNRFGHQTEDFLQTHLKIPRVDRFVVPGGAAWLVLRRGSLKGYDMAQSGLHLLVEHHGITRIVLVAHHDCGFYQAQQPHISDSGRRNLQETDLHEAADVLAGWFAGLKVETYYANVVDGRVCFEPV